MKIKVNDQVLITAGKDKGKVGKVLKTYSKSNKIVVESVNMRTKHVKKSPSQPGQKLTYEGPIDASNAMILDPKTNKPTRVKYNKLANNKKERLSVKSSSPLDNLEQPTKKDSKNKKIKA